MTKEYKCGVRSAECGVWRAVFAIFYLLSSMFSAHAELSATVYPGYTFRAGERPTVDTLNLAARPTVYVTGTLGGTNVGLAANTVSGAMLMTSVVDDTTIEFFDNSGVTAMRVKADGITETNLATSVAGDGLAGGASTALSVTVDTVRIGITNDTLTLLTNIPLNFLAATSNTFPYGHYSGYVTNLPASQFYTNLVGQVTFTGSVALTSISAAGKYIDTAHSLGATPRNLHTVMACTTADNGYSIGDEIDFANVWQSGGTSPAGTPWANSTNVGVSMIVSAASFQIPNKTNGASATPTAARWTLKVYARP